jgi:hypothetical protein
MKQALLALAFFLISTTAWAGLCTTMITRSCQPGKTCRTSETYTQLVNSEEECLSIARRFCPVYFSECVAHKQVRATFEGATLAGGQNLCQ